MQETVETVRFVIPTELRIPSKRTGESDLVRTKKKYAEAAKSLTSISSEALKLEKRRDDIEREQERRRLERRFLHD